MSSPVVTPDRCNRRVCPLMCLSSSHDRLIQHEHFAVTHQRAGWYRHHWEQTKVTERRRDSSLFWSLSGGTNSRLTSGQQSHSVCSRRLRTHMFRLHLDPTEHDWAFPCLLLYTSTTFISKLWLLVTLLITCRIRAKWVFFLINKHCLIWSE